MPDGTRLATTIFMPRAHRCGQKFPVLLELLPYRKDDTFFLMDYPTYSYFARRGFITVKVDIRGTGASQGSTPAREYSDIELADAEEIIRQLAAMEESNGHVAMWGISWSGFNAIQVAMRRPPALKAIIAMHSSDDLYHDDLHYIDGVMHLDPYHLFINHELGLPRTPRYSIDAHYFANRFDQKPWLFTYLSQQEDGDFWRRKSLRFQGYDKINIPVYLIGGLNDGYRDTVIRMLENLSGPVRADIGPWGHSSPDDGAPGPNYEWQDEAIEWLAPWLGVTSARAEAANRGSSMTPDKRRLMTFVRDGHEPDLDQSVSPGNWRVFDWPATGSFKTTLYPAADGKLLKSPGKRASDRMVATASSGTAAGWWWGETTDDMRQDDSQCLTYDRLVDEPIQIVGLPEVRLKVSSEAKRAFWSVRLEDVSPTGKVTLITGALVNGAHLNAIDGNESVVQKSGKAARRNGDRGGGDGAAATHAGSSVAANGKRAGSSLAANGTCAGANFATDETRAGSNLSANGTRSGVDHEQAHSQRLGNRELIPNALYEVAIKLHFTTWTFQNGHRIRLAVSNAQFPMAWPSAEIVASTIHTGSRMTSLTLPTVPTGSGKKPTLPAVARKSSSPYGKDVWIEDGKPDSRREVIRQADGTVSFVYATRSAWDIQRRHFVSEGTNTWTTNDKHPENSKYEGVMQHTITTAGRKLTLKTKLLVESDKKNFHVTVTRELRSAGKLIRRKTWQESIKRRVH